MIQEAPQSKISSLRSLAPQDKLESPQLIPILYFELMALRTLICRICKKQLTKKLVVYSRGTFFCIGCFAKEELTDDYQVINQSKLMKKNQGWTVLEQLEFIKQVQRYGIDDQPALGQNMTNQKSQEQVLAYISRHLCGQNKTRKKIKNRENLKIKQVQQDSISTTKTIKDQKKFELDFANIEKTLSANQYSINKHVMSWLHDNSRKEYIDYHLQQEILQNIEKEEIYRNIKTMIRGFNHGQSLSSKEIVFDSICSKQEQNKQEDILQSQKIQEQDLMRRSQSFITRWKQSTRKEEQRKEQMKSNKSKQITKTVSHINQKEVNKFNKSHHMAKQKRHNLVTQ